jgi:2-iminobutanoate/2-iminopropanoate deaminase
VGNTLYISGHIGLDAETGAPPASAEDEARLVMDGIKQTVEMAGFSIDDRVSVQIFCTDLTLYDTFNGVYKTSFHGNYPARAYGGASNLLRGGGLRSWGLRQKERSKATGPRGPRNSLFVRRHFVVIVIGHAKGCDPSEEVRPRAARHH